MPLFLFIFHIFYNIHTLSSHSYNTFICCHSLGPLSISSSLESSVGRPSLWCRAENRTRACLTASQHATNWATTHHNWAKPHHNWATPHHTEPRRTMFQNYRKNLLWGKVFLYEEMREYLVLQYRIWEIRSSHACMTTLQRLCIPSKGIARP